MKQCSIPSSKWLDPKELYMFHNSCISTIVSMVTMMMLIRREYKEGNNYMNKYSPGINILGNKNWNLNTDIFIFFIYDIYFTNK